MSEAGGRSTPLTGNYGATVVVVLAALCPNIVLTTAFQALMPGLGVSTHLTKGGLQLVEGLSNGAYAFGAVAAADFSQRFPQRRLFLIYEAIFVAGSALGAVGGSPLPFAAGRILQGLATGFLLVVAIPPLLTRFPAARLPASAAFVNVGLFGAVTLGPLVGGYVALHHGATLLFVVLALIGLLGMVLGRSVLEDMPAVNPGLSVDLMALVLAAGATALPFVGVSELTATSFLSPLFIAPVAVGLACLVALIVTQSRAEEPLMPVRLLSSTLPVAGTLCAMVAGAVFVTLLELVQVFLAKVAMVPPLSAGLLFWPQVAGLVLAAVAFGALFRTRWVPVLALGGLAALIVAGAVLLGIAPQSHVLVLGAAGALGFGAGATVSPGLFLAALGVPSSQVGRAFALVELLRSEAAYLLGPVVLAAAMSYPGALADGLRTGILATLSVAAAGTTGVVAVFLAGGARLRRPDLETWVGSGGQGLESRPVADALRPGADDLVS